MSRTGGALPPVIVLAEDDETIRGLLGAILRRNFSDHEVQGFEDGVAADAGIRQAFAQGRDVAMVVSDLVMPHMDGLELLERTAEADPDIARIILTGQGALDSAVQSLRMGVDDYLQKPFQEAELVRTLRGHLDRRALQRTNEALRERLTHNHRYVGRLVEAVLVRFDRYLEPILDMPQVGSEQRRSAMRARRALDLVARAYRVPSDYEVSFEVVSLDDVVDGAIRATLNGRPDLDAPFRVVAPSPMPRLRTDPSAARIALSQILDNALSAGPGRADVMLLGQGRNWPDGVNQDDLPVAVREALSRGRVGVVVSNTAAITRDDEAYMRRVIAGELEEADTLRGLGLPLAQLYTALLGGELLLQWQPKRSEVSLTVLLPGGTA
jgi:FixJ family two-component response regulator